MVRIIHILLLLELPALLQGQLFRGVVCDSISRESIASADIYFSGTTVGTSSDGSGRFIIDISGFPGRGLSVSALGYYTRTLSDIRTDSTRTLYLVPRIYEIGEVTVQTRSLLRQREKDLRLFRLEFLGSSSIAHSCRIMNEEVITFNYGAGQDTLFAFADAPIHIINRALGYDILYYLNRFSYDRHLRNTSFTGTIIYKDDLSAGFHTREIERSRRIAYSGSCMHFFRSLWNDQLKETPFQVYNQEGKKLGYPQIVRVDENGSKYLRYEGILEVYYFMNLSRIGLRREALFFDGSGFFDPDGISLQGRMSEKRVGDWLPWDYAAE
jgi:hypothetical protein